MHRPHAQPQPRPGRPYSPPLPSFALLLTLLTLLASTHAPADWPTHRATPGRTGLGNASLALPLHPLWSTSLPAPSPAWTPPARRSYWQRLDHLAARVAEDHTFIPILTSNSLVCGSSTDDHVRCFNLSSGSLRWTFAADGPVRYAPVISDNLVILGSDDGWIHALSLDDGSVRWRHRPGPADRRIPGNDRLISAWPIRSGLLLDRGIIYATAGLYPQQGTFACALNANDGSLLWQQPLDVSPEGYLLATDSLLIIPTGRASPVGLDRNSGRFIRAFDTGGGTYAVASQDEIFGGPGNAGTLAAVATQSNQRLLTVPGRNLVADGPLLHLLDKARLRTLDRARQAAALKRIRDLENQVRALQARKPASATNAASTPASAEQLAALGDQIAEQRRELDRCELWTSPCPEDLALIGTRNALIAGGTNRVAAFDRTSGRRLWQADVLGRALGLAAAHGLLAVTTDTGELHVFGPNPNPDANPAPNPPPSTPAPANPPPAPLPAPSLPETIRQGLAQTPPHDTRGYALIAGIGSTRLIHHLLDTTRLHVVAIDPDPRTVSRLRGSTLARGLYGRRLAAHVIPAGPLPFTDFFANLVLSESGLESKTQLPWSDTELERVTRPFGGLRWCHADAPPTRRGPLDGAGEWTHQFANPANTSSSGDQRIHANLALQWFGGPGPDLMVDRHLRGPAPLTAQGRLIVPGENQLIAVDAFNGSTLWRLDLPDSQRYTMPYDAGYQSLEAHTLAVAVRDACWIINAASGSVSHRFPVPVPQGETNPLHWGYTVLRNGHLFGSTQKATASRTSPSYELIDRDYNNDQPLVTGLSVFRADASSGRVQWHRRNGVILNTSLTLAANRLFLVESRAPDLAADPIGRIPLSRLLQGDPWLVAIDTDSGHTAWEIPVRGPIAESRNILYLATAGEQLVVLGSLLDPSNDTRYVIESRNVRDGSLLWSANHLARVPGEFTHGEQVHHPVILGHYLVAEPAVYDLRSGRRLPAADGSSPWNLIRPGHSCGTLSAAGDCLFFRAGNPTVMDLRASLESGAAPSKLSPSRTGCWINMIPAGGLLLIPEASAGCVCQFSLQTSMAFLPKPE